MNFNITNFLILFIERPEEPVDHRSLYDRLQEQKQKKDLEYEEAHKLKNMIKGLDDDEIEFLDLVDRTKMAADRKKNLEEEQELHDYRNRVANLQERAMENKLQAELAVNKPKGTNNSNRLSQHKLLKGVVLKKNDVRKRKLSENDDVSKDDGDRNTKKLDSGNDICVVGGEMGDKASNISSKYNSKPVVINVPEEKVVQGGLRCIGILPGMGCYTESSSECSSDSENDSPRKVQMDILGRKVVKKDKESRITFLRAIKKLKKLGKRNLLQLL